MSNRTVIAAVASVAVITSTACGDVASGPPVAPTVRDSAGVTIVENGPGVTTFVLEEVLRLGVVEEPGPEQFSQVFAVALGPDGQVVVGNNASGTVRVFDREGAFLTEFSGRGQGPSEIDMVNDLVVAGDTVAVIDWQHGGKVALFRLDGEFLDSWTPVRFALARLFLLHPSRAGWLVAGPLEPVFPPLAFGEEAVLSNGIYRLYPEGDSVGSRLYTLPAYVVYGVEGRRKVNSGVVPERWEHGFDDLGRVYLTDPRDYRIDVLEDWRLVRSIRRAYEPRSLGTGDVDEMRAAVLHAIDTTSSIPEQGRPQQRRQVSEFFEEQSRLPRPDHVPPLGTVLVSPDGAFWVERLDALSPSSVVLRRYGGFEAFFGGFPASDTSWDLFDGQGRYVGSVTLPRRFRPEAVDGLEVVGVFADDLDVEYVIKYEAAPVRGR